jgi:hypothetical protein
MKQSESSQDLLEFNKFHAMLYHGSATTGAQTSLLFPPTQWYLSYKQSEPSQDLLEYNRFHSMLYHGSATTGAQTSLLQLTLSSTPSAHPFRQLNGVLVTNLLVLLITVFETSLKVCWSSTSFMLCFVMEVSQQTPKHHHSSSSFFPPAQRCLSYKQSEPSQDLLEFYKFHGILYPWKYHNRCPDITPPAQWCLTNLLVFGYMKQSEPSQGLLGFNKFHAILYPWKCHNRCPHITPPDSFHIMTRKPL